MLKAAIYFEIKAFYDSRFGTYVRTLSTAARYIFQRQKGTYPETMNFKAKVFENWPTTLFLMMFGDLASPLHVYGNK